LTESTKKDNIETNNKEKEYLTYKEKKLIRSGNCIYYGNPEDKYLVCYKIISSKQLGSITISDDIIIELLTNNFGKTKLVKQARRENLFKAMDIGTFWLEDALENH
jgi:hypothetical protein